MSKNFFDIMNFISTKSKHHQNQNPDSLARRQTVLRKTDKQTSKQCE